MAARVLIPGLLMALGVGLVLWLAPLGLVLSLRGYSSQEITRMLAANEPQPDVTCPQTRSNDPSQAVADVDTPQASFTQGDVPASEPASNSAALSDPVPAAPPPARKIVATATVNVRSGAGTNFNVVGQFKPGETVTVVEDPAGDWVKVEGSTVDGWAYRPLFDKP